MADDDGGKKKRGLTPEQRLECRKAYETESPPPSISALAKRFGVKRETISKYRDDPKQPGGPWVPQTSGNVHGVDKAGEAAQARVLASVTDIASRRAINAMEADGTMERLVQEARSAMELQALLEREALELALNTVRRARVNPSSIQYNKDKHMFVPVPGAKVILDEAGALLLPLRGGTHTSEAGEIKDALAAANVASDMSRTMRGLKAGDASIDEENKQRRFRQFMFETKAERAIRLAKEGTTGGDAPAPQPEPPQNASPDGDG